MSEYHIVDVGFKDEPVLISTLKEMGYEPEIHKNAKNLYGYAGKKRSQSANIIIPRTQVGAASKLATSGGLQTQGLTAGPGGLHMGVYLEQSQRSTDKNTEVMEDLTESVRDLRIATGAAAASAASGADGGGRSATAQ